MAQPRSTPRRHRTKQGQYLHETSATPRRYWNLFGQATSSENDALFIAGFAKRQVPAGSVTHQRQSASSVEPLRLRGSARQFDAGK